MSDGLLRLRADRVEWRAVEGEIVALTLADDRYLGANLTGALLWTRLAEGATFEALVTVLVDAGAPEGRPVEDTEIFLAALRQRGLLEG